MLGVLHASLFGPNIFLSTLLSNTLSLSSSLNMKDHVSHPYQTTGKITVLFVLISLVSEGTRENKILERMTAFPEFNLLVISSCMQFWFVCRSQIFGFGRIVIGNITSLCDLILSYLLRTRHNHSLSFASTYFYTPQNQQLINFLCFL